MKRRRAMTAAPAALAAATLAATVEMTDDTSIMEFLKMGDEEASTTASTAAHCQRAATSTTSVEPSTASPAPAPAAARQSTRRRAAPGAAAASEGASPSSHSDSSSTSSGSSSSSSSPGRRRPPAPKSGRGGRGRGRGVKRDRSRGGAAAGAKASRQDQGAKGAVDSVSVTAESSSLKAPVADLTTVKPAESAADLAKPAANADQVSAERRDAVRAKLEEALGGDDVALRLAQEAEAALFEALAPGPAYHRQARSLLFNLRGATGNEFKAALRVGVFPAEMLPKLQTEDMAPSSKKAERTQVRREAMEACESDWDIRREKVVMNGMFTCGKCGGNRTWYFQFQTRACDEPMEFFVMCRECNHGWRHNEDSPDDIFRQVWAT